MSYVKILRGVEGSIRITFTVAEKENPEVNVRVAESLTPYVRIDDVVDAIVAENTVFESLNISGTRLSDEFLQKLRERQVTVKYLLARDCPHLSASGLIEFATQTKGMKDLTVMRCQKYEEVEFALALEHIDLLMV